jgi:hypothetical protein
MTTILFFNLNIPTPLTQPTAAQLTATGGNIGAAGNPEHCPDAAGNQLLLKYQCNLTG